MPRSESRRLKLPAMGYPRGVIRRRLAQRPLRKLGKLELRVEPVSPSFAETMRQAGAVPLAGEKGRVAPPSETATPLAAPLAGAAPSFSIEQDADWLEGFRKGLSARERSRLNGVPGATLDLHGQSARDARSRLAAFIAREHELGRERVLVIVGKGLRAPGGTGVLRSSIGEWLSQPPLARHVLAFRTAPREQGGNGAVVVLLARRTGKKA